VRSPVTRCHVVWAFDVTIERCWPMSRLSSVDFPAFGRPSSVTYPVRVALNSEFDSSETVIAQF
jgi:hypothetical protein